MQYDRFPALSSGLHDSILVTGTPLFEGDHFVIKFHNLWTIEAPEGYSLLFTHPVNRFDLPFTTLTGWVDLRQLSRWLDSLSGAMARHEFQRRIAERYAGDAMFSGEAGKNGIYERLLSRMKTRSARTISST